MENRAEGKSPGGNEIAGSSQPLAYQGSVEQLIERLRKGDDQALGPLWERYFEKLVKVARGRLPVGSPARVIGGSMDAALSALQSFQARLGHGEFSWVTSRGDLWKLLVTMTRNKAIKQAQRASALKRHPREGLVRTTELGNAGEDSIGLEQLVSEEPSPELAVELAEHIERIHRALNDPELSRVFELRLEGYSREEIGVAIGRVVRSVTRKLKFIRETVELEFRRDDD